MYALIVFLPLAGSVLAGLLSLNNQDRPAELVTVIGLLSSLLLSVIAFAEVAIGGTPITVDIGRWIVSGDFAAQWALRFDTMTAVMLIVVSMDAKIAFTSSQLKPSTWVLLIAIIS